MWMGVIKEDIRAYVVDEVMNRDREGWREKVRVSGPPVLDKGKDKKEYIYTYIFI